MMRVTSLLFAGALAVIGLSVANAKSYTVTVADPMVVGQTQLQPGVYTLEVQGTNALFTSEESSKTIAAPVAQIENVSTKFDQTSFVTVKQGAAERLKEIDLGGSRTKLDFN